MQNERLINGNYYHIYNRGNNGRDLFRDPDSYEHFLGLLDKYILPIADIYAWVLMPNHFHLLAYIKENVVYKYSYDDWPDNAAGPEDAARWFKEHKWETVDLDLTASGAHDLTASEPRDFGAVSVKIPVPHLHFSHLFNAYTKYLNTRIGGHGNLFERPFNRKLIDNDRYLQRVVLYIHNNPVHHGFCSHPLEYPWSSYLTCISLKPTKLKREKTLGWFDNEANFKHMHNEKVETEKIEKWLELEH
jgi:REP element-mobilizing transposase RayT